MANFARIINNVAVDVCPNPTEMFFADLAAQFVPVPDDVQPGWVLTGSTWAAPDATPPAPLVLSVAQLQDYANVKTTSLLAASRVYDVSGVTIKSDATAPTLANWMALMKWGELHAGASTLWVANDNSVVTITSAQIAEVAPIIGGYAQSVYSALAGVLAAISAATPSITTTAEIDAYAWPV